MQKTAKQIQGDIYKLLATSPIMTNQLSGKVYRNGYRPRDSRQEDTVVTFTAGLPGQIQTGIVTINIYVPDIDPDDNGTWVEDGERTAQVEDLAQQWVNALTADTMPPYIFALQDTIHTVSEPDIDQHFVTIRLKFKHCNETI